MINKIIIAGATGLIGRHLTSELIKRGNQVTVFTRNIDKAKQIVPGAKEYFEWDYYYPQDWAHLLEKKDVVINLAGANLFDKRWNENYKEVIRTSRILTTGSLVSAISQIKNKPNIFISASAVGFYGNGGENLITEDSPAGDDFLAKLCFEWENEASKANNYGLRTINLRTGIVLSADGGAFQKILKSFKFYTGGYLGSGNQWFPWIHIYDAVNSIIFAINNNKLQGPINVCSPNPVRMKEFSNLMGKILKKPSFFNIPEFALKIILGESAQTIIDSLKVYPNKLISNGFSFKFEDLDTALKDLLKLTKK